MNTIRELWNNRKMIWKLSRNDFKTKYAGSYFGILWAFVQPIVTTLIYVIIFQAGVKVQPTAAGYPYALVLISGIIPWFFFSEALQNSTTAAASRRRGTLSPRRACRARQGTRPSPRGAASRSPSAPALFPFCRIPDGCGSAPSCGI